MLQAKGSLAETNLRSLLEEAQAERATGTLTLNNGDVQPTTLYFLFGHLFHALGEGAAGDEAVVSALTWQTGQFSFDAKAKLPADETVKSTIPDLLSRANSSGHAAPKAEPEPPAPAPAPVFEPPPPAAIERMPKLAAEPNSAAQADPPPTPEPPSRPPSRLADPQTPPPRFAPPTVVGAAGRAEESLTSRAAFRTSTNSDSGGPLGVKHRPQPRHGREPIPVPAGQVIYDSLKTSFVDFPRLITTLERESYTGYVRLLTEQASGLIFFREGKALECIYDAGEDPTPERGRSALHAFNDEVTNGHGVLDVVGLGAELVDGLYELTVAKPLYAELYASWVDMNALLKFLEERRLSGSVMVRAAAGTGVIILNDGQLAGAYTSESREISSSAGGVLSLCNDPGAQIEVKAAVEARREPLRVDDILGPRAAAGRSSLAESTPVPAPPAASRLAPPAAAPPAPPPSPPPSDVRPAWAQQPEPPTSQFPSLTPSTPQQTPSASSASGLGPLSAGGERGGGGVGAGLDWEAVVAELQQMTEEALGNRSRKVKDVLGGAERSQPGIENAINQIPSISILFVDSSRLEALANDLRAKLYSHLG